MYKSNEVARVETCDFVALWLVVCPQGQIFNSRCVRAKQKTTPYGVTTNVVATYASKLSQAR